MAKQKVAINFIPWNAAEAVPGGAASLTGDEVPPTEALTEFVADLVKGLESDAQVLCVLPLATPGEAVVVTLQP